jgi:hypothetical protein
MAQTDRIRTGEQSVFGSSEELCSSECVKYHGSLDAGDYCSSLKWQTLLPTCRCLPEPLFMPSHFDSHDINAFHDIEMKTGKEWLFSSNNSYREQASGLFHASPSESSFWVIFLQVFSRRFRSSTSMVGTEQVKTMI